MSISLEDLVDADELLAAQEAQAAEELFNSGLVTGVPVEQDVTAPAIYQRREVYNLAKFDLNFLASLAIPDVFTYNFPALYTSIWVYLTGKAVLVRDFSKFLLGLPRGHAKTTMMKLFILWCILFSQKKFILIVGSTARLAENILADVSDMLDEENIKSVFGNWRIGIETDRQDLKKFSFLGRTVILAALGAEGSLRGLNLKNERPDVMLMEDIQTRENALSKPQSEGLETWMLSTLLKAKSPKGCLTIFIGNMYPPDWCIIKKLKKSKYWISIITGGILADGTALWEELFPLKQMLEEFEQDDALGHPEIFCSEVLNDGTAGLNSRFDLTKLPELRFTEFDHPQGRFIIIDPAGDSTTSDDNVITQFEVYDNIPVARKIKMGHFSPGDLIRNALELALETRTFVIGVETVQYQKSLLYWFEIITMQLNIQGIQFVDLNPHGISKNSRITDMLKAALAGELYWHPEVKALIEHEITQWNPMKSNNVDNILDTLAYAPQMLLLYGNLCFIPNAIGFEDLTGSSVVEDNCAF